MDDRPSALAGEPLSIAAMYARALLLIRTNPRALIPGGLATFYGGLVSALILSLLMTVDPLLRFDQSAALQHPLHIFAMLLLALIPGLYTAARFWVISLRAYACVAIDQPYRWGALIRGSWSIVAEFLTKLVAVFFVCFVPPMLLNALISFGVIVIIALIDAGITMNVHHLSAHHTLTAVSHNVDNGAIIIAIIATLPIWANWSALLSILAPSILLENNPLPEMLAIFTKRLRNKTTTKHLFRYGIILFIISFVAMAISTGGATLLQTYHHYRTATMWNILINMLTTGYLVALSVVFFLDYRIRYENLTQDQAQLQIAPYINPPPTI